MTARAIGKGKHKIGMNDSVGKSAWIQNGLQSIISELAGKGCSFMSFEQFQIYDQRQLFL